MSQIGETELALLGLLRTCQLPSGTSIESSPSKWDGGYIQRLISHTPAVRLAFLGADPYADPETTTLSLSAKWGCYCVVGWNGKDQELRRTAVDGGYDLVSRVAPIMHNPPLLEDSQRQRLPIPRVIGIETLTDSSIDVGNLWICEVLVEVELPLDIPPDCEGDLDDFIRVRASFDIPGGEPLPDAEDAGTLGDLPARQDLDQ